MTLVTTMAAGPLFEWAWRGSAEVPRWRLGDPGSAERLCPRCIRHIYGRNPFYTRKLDAAGIHPRVARVSARSVEAAAHNEARADCRSAGVPSVGDQPQRAARQIHALQPDVIDDRKPAAMARHERELAVDARVLEGRVRGREGRRARPDLLSVFIRAVSRILDGVRGGLPDRSRAAPGSRGGSMRAAPPARRPARRRCAGRAGASRRDHGKRHGRRTRRA